MNHCNQCQLRLWPVVHTGPFRLLDKPDYVTAPDGGRMDLKTGQFFHVPHWVLHRAEEHWGSDADSFDPMRKWNDKAFMPFTKAPRDCIGRNFATMEMRCALVALLHYFTFEPVDGADAAPKSARPPASARIRPHPPASACIRPPGPDFC